MKTAGTQHFIERTYREGSQFQWVRESYINAVEAGATKVEFGVEWQAVESQGVYRRLIADNGSGMTADKLVEFFNTFGGSGKPIGGAHENFGVGAKTSLLPWNQYGMVVISWVDGDASMIWVARNPKTGEYGLKLESCEGPNGTTSLEGVYDPYEDATHGCDWSTIKPDWIEDHGTVVVLLGNNATANTVEGDPTRNETDIKGISSFLNRRIWEIPSNIEVYVDELRNADKSLWPISNKMAHDWTKNARHERRTNTRRIEGAKYFVDYQSERQGIGKVGAKGTVGLKDGTNVDWYLWEGERPKVHSYASIGGYIGALYKNELYDLTSHHSTYRSFGISESSIRSRLWLVVRPVVEADGKGGVYPKTDRNSLLIRGGKSAGGPLPINDWAAEFAEQMPNELVQALRSCRQGDAGTVTDEEWREKLADKFGSRWRISRLVAKLNGGTSFDADGTTPIHPPIRKRKINPGASGGQGGAGSSRTPRTLAPSARSGKSCGSLQGELSPIEGGLPSYRTVGADAVGPGILAAWQPKDPDYPEGVVLINVDHPVLISIIEHWQSQYADHHAEEIAKDVIQVYGQVAVSKIAHSEHLKSIIASQTVDKMFRSEEALTMSLLGLMAEDHLISTRVGGKYSKKRLPISEKRGARQPVPND